MKAIDPIQHKIYSLAELLLEVKRWKLKSKSIVLTNGIFDMLHKGHIASISQAASLGDILIVAMNSDASVKRLKGDSRPINDEQSRAIILASLVMTDAVVVFEEDTPLDLIKAIMPDVLVKGGDYEIHQIAGAKEVINNGGKVILADMIEGISTTRIIEKMKQG